MVIKMLDCTNACIVSSYANSLDLFAFDDESLAGQLAATPLTLVV